MASKVITKVSELIDELNRLVSEFGDSDIIVYESDGVEVSIMCIEYKDGKIIINDI